MARDYPNIALHVPQLLLPAPAVAAAKWAVIACDQHSAAPAYWQETARLVGDAPSTLNLVLPEAHLGAGDRAAAVAAIHARMETYLADGTLVEQPPGFMLVERAVDGGAPRRGLVVALDLAHYDYRAGSASQIRSTEGTDAKRLPARIDVRDGAPLETPHILVLIDDPERTVIEPLCRERLPLAYDFELMQGGGRLRGWRVAAPLGDNHASAAGCGAAEYDTAVLSLGTSGTVNLPAPHARQPAGEALGFEYWDDRLFLVMLAQCGAWYERFRAEAAPGVGHDELNRMAMSCPPDRIVRVPEPDGAGAALTGLTGADLPAQAASTQCSIALEMLDRVRAMLPSAAEPIRSFVLTGGLSRSPLINGVVYAGLRMLAERDGRVAAGARVLLNDRSGPLAYKTDALGALVNARIAAGSHSAAGGRSARDVIAADRRWRPCAAPRPEHERRLRRLIDDAGRASSPSPPPP